MKSNSKIYYEQCLKTTRELLHDLYAKEWQPSQLESKELFIQRKIDESLKGLDHFNSLAASGLAAFNLKNLEVKPSEEEMVALSNMASQALQEKKYADSLSMFAVLIILETYNFEFYLGAGLSCFLAGNPQEAEGYYAMALHTGPKSAKAHLYAADYYYCIGQKGKAADLLERAMGYLEDDDPLQADADLLKIKFRS